MLMAALMLTGVTPVSAAIQQDAEKAVDRQMQEARQSVSSADAIKQLAHSHVKLTDAWTVPGASLSIQRVKKLIPELKNDTVDVAVLAKQLAAYNHRHAPRIHVDFRPDKAQEGAWVAVVRTSQGKAGGGNWSLSFDNNGSPYTGEARATLTYQNSDATGHGDTLGAAFVTSPDHPDRVLQGAAAYRWTLPKTGDAVTVSASYSEVKLDDLAEGYPFDIASSGKSTRIGLAYEHALEDHAASGSSIELGLDYHRSDSDAQLKIAGLTVPLVDYGFDHVDATLAWQGRRQMRRDQFRWRAGLQANLTGSEDDFHEMTAGSDRRYLIWHGDVSEWRRLPADWLLSARASGQYTSQTLIGCERFGAGGRSSVRGFDENIRTADTGASGTLELYTPEFAKGLRLLAFLDGATLHGNGAGDGSRNLASTGLGLRYYTDTFQFALDYAAILDEPDDVKRGPEGHRRWNVWGGCFF